MAQKDNRYRYKNLNAQQKTLNVKTPSYSNNENNFATPSIEIYHFFNPPQAGLKNLLTLLTSRSPPYC